MLPRRIRKESLILVGPLLALADGAFASLPIILRTMR